MTSLRFLLRVGFTSAMLMLAACGNTPSRTAAHVSPDALMADAMQRQIRERDPARALATMRMAAAQAPDRADVVWLYSQLCGQTRGCESESADAALRRLDPANGAAWLNALGRARERNDVAAENEILDAIGDSERFDVYWNTLTSKITLAASARVAAQNSLPVSDALTAILNGTIGWLSGILLPGFDTLGEACSAARAGNPVMAERCRRVAAVLMRGDSYMAESVGLGIAQRMARPNSAEVVDVAQRIQYSRAQRDAAGQVIASQVERDKFTAELLKLMSSLHREQDVFAAVLRWAGVTEMK